MNRNRIARRMVKGRQILVLGLVLAVTALEIWMVGHCCADFAATSRKSKIPAAMPESVSAPNLIFVSW